MYRTIASCAGVGLVVVMLVGSAVAGSAQGARSEYTYFDDFSEDVAMLDSYSHSEFVDEVPDYHLDGLLCYVSGIMERALGFFGGFELNSDAYLFYRFPVEGTMPGITSGRLDFEIPIAWQRPPQGTLVIDVFYDGAAGGFSDTLNLSGVYGYDLLPPVPCQRVFVHFSGDGLALDDLSVSLAVATPVSEDSWGMIKALFR